MADKQVKLLNFCVEHNSPECLSDVASESDGKRRTSIGQSENDGKQREVVYFMGGMEVGPKPGASLQSVMVDLQYCDTEIDCHGAVTGSSSFSI